MNRERKCWLCGANGTMDPLDKHHIFGAGCQPECEEYKKYASAVAEFNKTIREAKRKEYITWLSTT